MEKIEREAAVRAALATLESGEGVHYIRDQVEKKRKRESEQSIVDAGVAARGVAFHQRYENNNLTSKEIRAAKKQRKSLTNDKRLEAKRLRREEEE